MSALSPNSIGPSDFLVPAIQNVSAAALEAAPEGRIASLCWRVAITATLLFALYRRRQAVRNLPLVVKKPFDPSVGQGTMVEAYRRIIYKYGNIDLLSLNHIPEDLHDDPYLRKYICTITQAPARHAVCDPNKKTIYDRVAIEEWLKLKGTSPVTRKPLQAYQLTPVFGASMIIEARLRFHEERMKALRAMKLAVDLD